MWGASSICFEEEWLWLESIELIRKGCRAFHSLIRFRVSVWLHIDFFALFFFLIQFTWHCEIDWLSVIFICCNKFAIKNAEIKLMLPVLLSNWRRYRYKEHRIRKRRRRNLHFWQLLKLNTSVDEHSYGSFLQHSNSF